jgi:hypothetical protein
MHRLGVDVEWNDFFLVEGDDMVFDADILSRHNIPVQRYEEEASQLGMDVKLELHNSMSDANFLGFRLGIDDRTSEYVNTPADPYSLLSKLFWDPDPNLASNRNDRARLAAKICSVLSAFPRSCVSDYLVTVLRSLQIESAGAASAVRHAYNWWWDELGFSISEEDLLDIDKFLARIGYVPGTAPADVDIPAWASEAFEVVDSPRTCLSRTWFGKSLVALQNWAAGRTANPTPALPDNDDAFENLPACVGTRDQAPDAHPIPHGGPSPDDEQLQETDLHPEPVGDFLDGLMDGFHFQPDRIDHSMPTVKMQRMPQQVVAAHDMGSYHPGLAFSDKPLMSRVCIPHGADLFVHSMATRDYLQDHSFMETSNPELERQRQEEITNTPVYFKVTPGDRTRWFANSAIFDCGGNGACLLWAYGASLYEACDTVRGPLAPFVHALTRYVWSGHRCSTSIYDLPPLVSRVECYNLDNDTIEHVVFPTAPNHVVLRIATYYGHYFSVVYSYRGAVSSYQRYKEWTFRMFNGYVRAEGCLAGLSQRLGVCGDMVSRSFLSMAHGTCSTVFHFVSEHLFLFLCLFMCVCLPSALLIRGLLACMHLFVGSLPGGMLWMPVQLLLYYVGYASVSWVSSMVLVISFGSLAAQRPLLIAVESMALTAFLWWLSYKLLQLPARLLCTALRPCVTLVREITH